MQKYFVKFLFLIFLFVNSNSHALDSIAKEAYLLDLNTGQVLLDLNSESKTYPSSMTKMMTVLVAFDKISKGQISLNQKFLVSKKAWRMGGSKMFVEV
ncbi:MAG: serine hydrolase, partial [Proteobacteria bacterium]|nr:serine hydrolase [Pseudomonadota bacterium]